MVDKNGLERDENGNLMITVTGKGGPVAPEPNNSGGNSESS
jgi:hypothetical protein